MEKIRFEYKGFTTICEPNPNDKGRLYGHIYPPESPTIPLGDLFAANTVDEAKARFESKVRYIISKRFFHEKQDLWLKNADWKSVGYVLDIMPKEFKERIATGKFDKTFLEKVAGGDYEVPLYYVTKAWDFLLKNNMGPLGAKIGPEDYYKYYGKDYKKLPEYQAELKEFIADLKEDLEEDVIVRTRDEACSLNEEMKLIWEEEFGINIDKLDIDFTKFNMHLPPQIERDSYNWYFFEDPMDSVQDWILDGINFPSGECTFDKVSTLMEFAAMIKYENFCNW